MFKKLLYPTDFSSASEKVLPYLKDLKKAGAEELIILHIIDERIGEWKESLAWMTEKQRNDLVNDCITSLNDKANTEIENLKKEFGSMFKLKIVVEQGTPFKKILDTANKENVSCIIMGSKGASDLQEMILGSVVERVVRKSKQPCLIVK